MGRGSSGNVLAALASFFIPGLGQLLQGRWLLAAFMFAMTWLLWIVLLGWVIEAFGTLNALIPAMFVSLALFIYGSLYTSVWRYRSPVANAA